MPSTLQIHQKRFKTAGKEVTVEKKGRNERCMPYCSAISFQSNNVSSWGPFLWLRNAPKKPSWQLNFRHRTGYSFQSGTCWEYNLLHEIISKLRYQQKIYIYIYKYKCRVKVGCYQISKEKTNKFSRIPLASLNIWRQTIIVKRSHCMIAPFKTILQVDL